MNTLPFTTHFKTNNPLILHVVKNLLSVILWNKFQTTTVYVYYYHFFE